MFRHVKNSWGLVYFSFGLRFGKKTTTFFKSPCLQRGFTPFPGKDVWRHIQGHTLVWGVCCSSTGYFETVLKMDLKTYRHRCKIDTKHSGTELLRSSLRASRAFLALVFFTVEESTIKWQRMELNCSPPCCHSVFKVPVVPLAHLHPVNLTQPSSPEDLGSNKGLTPRPAKLLLCWRRWLASPQPRSLHAIPAPATSALSSEALEQLLSTGGVAALWAAPPHFFLRKGIK